MECKRQAHMTAEEISRRVRLHQDYVGDVILTPSVIPDNPQIVSFKEQQTPGIFEVLTSCEHHLSKEQQYDYKGPAQKLRVWYSGPTTRAVRRTFADAGFICTRREETAWNLCWGSPKQLQFYQTLAPGQICNQIPGSNGMGRKDCLAQYIRKAAVRHPDLYNFTPTTFLIPDQATSLLEDMQANADNTEVMYIYKPALGARGNGIQVLSGNDTIEDMETSAVVQHYIMNPLLIKGFKFDMRIYVLVTSVDPYIFYIYDEGLGRFATERFVRPDDENKTHVKMHLTNFAVNSNEGQEGPIVKLAEGLPSKWKLSELLDYLDANRQYFDQGDVRSIVNQVDRGRGALRAELWRRICALVKLTMVAVEPRMYQCSVRVGLAGVYPRRNFGLYGFDIMVTALGELRLIEVNSSPATGTSTALDAELKFELLSDVLHLVGVCCYRDGDGRVVLPQRRAEAEAQCGPVRPDPWVRPFQLRPNEPQFSTVATQLRRSDGCYATLNAVQLTRFERRVLWQLVDEDTRHGRFTRLMPSGSEADADLFEERHYLNELAGCFVRNGGNLSDPGIHDDYGAAIQPPQVAGPSC